MMMVAVVREAHDLGMVTCGAGTKEMEAGC